MLYLWLGLALLLGLAVFFDIKERRVPNRLLLVFIIIVPLLLVWRYEFLPRQLLPHLVCALIVFSVGLVFWLLGWMGAGDVKLLGVLGLFFPYQQAADLLLNTAFAGLLLAVLVWPLVNVLMRSLRSEDSGAQQGLQNTEANAIARDDVAARKHKGLPYAIAIAAGGIATLLGVSPLPT